VRSSTAAHATRATPAALVALVALVALTSLVACGGVTDRAPRRDEATGAATSAIVNGADSDDSQDAVVLVLHYDALSKDGSAGCTGTLLAPRLVLTARHCVAVTDPQAACASDGTPLAGGAVHDDFDATKLYVFAGRTRPDFLSGTPIGAKGRKIIDDGADTLCNHDVALVLLDRPLAGAKIAPIRLDGGPKKGEALTLVGWGITQATNTPETRQTKTGVKILDVGPADGLAPAEFLVGEGGCAGDSGGPALSVETGAVIGSLSRGGNGTGDTGADGCVGGTNVYTSAASFRDMILSAYEEAGQEPWLEGGVDPTLAKPAPEPDDAGGADGGDGGCASAPAPRRAPGAALLALSAAALVLARRRRRAFERRRAS
jgi:hypothetical protein